MAKSFSNDLNDAIMAWIPVVSGKIQNDFAMDAGAKLKEVSLLPEGAGFRLEYQIPDKSETNIPTQEKEIWVPASKYMATDKKSGRKVTRTRKGHKKKINVEVPNLDRDSAMQQEDGKSKSSANSAYRVVELALDYNFGDELPKFLESFLKSKGWELERK